jgi:hypothetical protein
VLAYCVLLFGKVKVTVTVEGYLPGAKHYGRQLSGIAEMPS